MSKGSAKNHPAIHPGNPNFFVWASLVVVTLMTIAIVALVYGVRSTKEAYAFPEATTPDGWVTDGVVNAITSDGTKTYVGGDFTYVGEYTGATAVVDTTTGALATDNPRLNLSSGQSTQAIEADGNGGWYVAGEFTNVDGTTVNNNLVHFNSDGSLDTNFVSPTFNVNMVEALLLDGTTLYVGGGFSTINGQTRGKIAAVNATTGALLSWAPQPVAGNGTVLAIAKQGSKVYIGGTFSSIDPPNAGVTTRSRIAAVDATTGDLDLSWNPNMNNTVNDIEVKSDHSTVFAAGEFTTVGGAARVRLVSLDPANDSNTGAAQGPWDPDANGSVRSITFNNDQSLLYVGGAFTCVQETTSGGACTDGTARTDLYAVGTDTSVAAPVTSWAPTTDASVYGVAMKGSDIAIVGDFTSVNSTTRYRIAALDTAGTLTSWDPKANALVGDIDIAGSRAFVSGTTTLSSVGGSLRNRVAAFSNTTLDVDATFNPNNGATAGEVFTLLLNGSELFVGGSFTGGSQNRLMKLNATTGALIANWVPNPNTGQINDMVLDGTTLYVAGSFTAMNPAVPGGNQTRNRLAALDTTVNTTTTNPVLSWNPNSGGIVDALEQDASNIYAGGQFTTIGGGAQVALAKISKATGANQSFTSPWTLTGETVQLEISGDGSQLYGYGGNANCSTGRDLVRLSTTDGTVDTTWFSGFGNVPSAVQALTLDETNGKVYLGGTFTTAPVTGVSCTSGSSRQRLAEVGTDGSVGSWNPGTNNTVFDIGVVGNRLFAGGQFTITGRSAAGNEEHRKGLSVYSTNTIQFTATSSSGGEALTPANIEVSLAATDASDTTVQYSVTGGSASGSGVDYTLANGTATVTAGNLTTNIPITIVNDAIDENDETIEITLSSPSSNASIGSNSVHTYTIQDNDTVGVTVTESSGSTNVTEAGGTDTYTVVLNSQPTDTVSIAVTGDAQASGAPTPLSFTTGNWDTPQVVTVSATNDAIVEGAHTGTLTHAATSSDGAYNGISIGSVTANITDNDTAGVTISETGGSTNVTEGGATDTYSVVLTSQPSDNVDIALSFDGQINATPSPLTFTNGDWNSPQLVTVSAIDDGAVEGPHGSSVSHAATSNDGNYDGIAISSVTVNITDNDTPAVTINESGGSTQVTEGSTTDSYTVVLATQPSASVTVNVTGDSQVTPDQSSLTFTTVNWDDPQTIVATPTNDAVAEGLHTGTITHSASSTDGDYNGISIADVEVSITDNDSPGVSIVQSGGGTTATEGGAGDSYTVVLLSEPTSSVSIALTPNSEVTAGPTPLTFTTGNWDTPQAVTVNAVDDAVADSADLGNITHAATSSDGNYNGIAIASVSVSITDNDTAGITITQSGGSTNATEGGAGDSYTIVLTSEPTANVVVTLTPDSQTGATPSPLTFTTGNWNTPQTVTVSATNDLVAEGPHLGSVHHDVASGDGNYNNFSVSDVTVNITDNDTAGVTVTQSGGSTQATEGGSGDSYTLVLTSQPTDNVVITVTPDANVTATPPTVTFTNGNWNTPQAVTVGAVNDAIAEGSHVGIVTNAASSDDNFYDGASVASVTVMIADNDTASIVVTESDGDTEITEGDGNDSYQVVLTSQPTQDVQITMAHGDDVTVTPSALLFSDSDWNVAQTVIVSAVDDSAIEGTHNDIITHNAISSDTNYSGITIDDVSVTINDDDTTPPPGGGGGGSGLTPPQPTPQEPAPETITQIGGSSARAQSIAVSQARFKTAGTANGVVLATEKTAIDAFSSTPLVLQNGYTLMLSDGVNVSADVLLEMKRVLGDPCKPIYMIGGVQALSEDVEEDIRAAGFCNILRLAGKDRRRTAELVAEAVAQHNPLGVADIIFVTEDTNLIDGLSVGSASVSDSYTTPILITRKGSGQLDPTVSSFIKNHAVRKIQVIGGPAVVPLAIEPQLLSAAPNAELIRYAGNDRYETNQRIVETFFPSPTVAVATRGEGASIAGASVGATTSANTLVTALLANTLGGTFLGPVVLINASFIPAPTVQYLTSHANTINQLYIVGDFAAISQSVIDALTGMI
jgi:putative cell wall-binding protein